MRLAWAVLAVCACGATPPTGPVAVPPVSPAIVASATVAPTGPTCTSALRGATPKIRDAMGDPLELMAVEGFHVTATAWLGEDLILLRRIAELGYSGRALSAIERYAPPDRTPRMRVLIPSEARAMAVTLDGKRLVLALDNAIAIHDATTGAEESRFPIAGRLGLLETAGTGDALVILATLDGRVAMFDRHGAELDRFTVEGTTPTIRRVYNDPDHPTHHDNILKTEKSWAEAIAASADGRWLAIGGSDSKVQIHDRKRGGKPKILAFPWKYQERRHQGGNPDLNQALAMRFSADAKQLVVVHAKGEVITWDVARGTQVKKLSGACTTAETSVLVNRYDEPGTPARVPTAKELAECGPASSAAIAPDGSWYASDVGLVRIRALPSGAPIAMVREVEIPGELVISRGGTLGIVDIYGRAALWTAKDGVRDLLPTPESTGPLSPHLSRSGRVLAFELGRRTVAWDLVTGTSVAVGTSDRVVALSDDASQQIVATPAGFELRAKTAQPLALPAGRFVFSASGTHILDITENQGLIVFDLARKTQVTLKRSHFASQVLRDDGRWLATFGPRDPLQIWDTRTGKAVATLETGVVAVAFFGDGKRMVTVGAVKKDVTVKVRDIAGKPSDEIALVGWIAGIDIAPDDRELLIAFEDRIVRHSMLDRTQREAQVIGQRRARYANADTVVLEGYNQIEIRRTDDALTLIGHVYPLLTGGYVVASVAGAVHGSADAPDGIVSLATGRQPRVWTGRETWKLWARPDTYACALAGEISAPP